MICTKCQYNGKRDSHCLSCTYTEDSYYHDKDRYILDTYDPPCDDLAHATTPKVTALDDETEDKLRQLLIAIFHDLTPLQILVMSMIMKNDKGLNDIGKDIELFFKTTVNQQQFSRFRVFQIRKKIISKIPDLKNVLITVGQRKELKHA